jgi:hypothetical protein
MKAKTSSIAIALISLTAGFSVLEAKCHQECQCPVECPCNTQPVDLTTCCVPQYFSYGMPSRFTVFGDFIYWRTDVENTEVAEKGTESSSNPLVASVKTLQPKGKWRAGFRAGIGGKFGECDNTELMLGWTHLNARSAHVQKSTTAATDIILPMGSSLLGPRASSVNAFWKLHINVLDLDWGRTYFPANRFTLTPHAGMRGALFNFHMHQNFDSIWSFYTPAATPTPAGLVQQLGSTSNRSKFNYAGAGIKAGTDAAWRLSECWSVVGKLGLSLLYGKYNIKQHLEGFATDGLIDGSLLLPADIHFKKDMWRMRSNLEAFLGVMVEKTFGCDDQYDFAISVGYEMSQWFQLNEIPQIQDNYNVHTEFDAVGTPFVASNYFASEVPTHGDISSQGITVKVVIDF